MIFSEKRYCIMAECVPEKYVAFVDGEYWLIASQVVSFVNASREKSGKKLIDVKYLHHYVIQNRLHPRKVATRLNWYPWSDVQMLTNTVPSGPKPKPDDELSQRPASRYQRRWYNKRKARGTVTIDER